MDNLSVGTLVIIKGLKSAAQYNGKHGIIAEPYNPDKGRYNVLLIEGQKKLAVRPTNFSIPNKSNQTESTDVYCEEPWCESKDQGELLGDLFQDLDPEDKFDYEFVLPKDGRKVKLHLEGVKQELGQTLKSTGLTIWPAAPILCTYLTEHGEELLQGKNVLELGAGLGLAGLLAANMCTSIVLTDGDTETLSLLRKNVSQNAKRNDNGVFAKVQCGQLRWGINMSPFAAKYSPSGGFDVILGSDIIYSEDIISPLFDTVNTLLCQNKDAAFLLSYVARNVSITEVLKVAKSYNFNWVSPPNEEGVFRFQRSKIVPTTTTTTKTSTLNMEAIPTDKIDSDMFAQITAQLAKGAKKTEKRQEKLGKSKNADVLPNGTNAHCIICKVCGSIILRPEASVQVEKEIFLHSMKRLRPSDPNGEVVSSFWFVNDRYKFENVGVSKPITGHDGQNQNMVCDPESRYLVCADCDKGPIGSVNLKKNEFYVACDRVAYK